MTKLEHHNKATKRLMSRKIKESWKNPEIRAKRIAGLRKSKGLPLYDKPEPYLSQWAVIIPFKNKRRAKYAAEKLKDYSVMEKYLKEVHIDKTDEEVEYLYL